MSEWAFVALGSNLGDRASWLARGREALAALPDTEVVEATAPEETEPIGPGSQGPYLNQMVLVNTALAPGALLEAGHEAERRAGRDRSVGERWGPRTLDMDLVRYGEVTSSSPALRLPHPELARRGFWVRELAALVPRTFNAREAGFPDWAVVTDARRAHIDRVVGLVAAWGMARGVPVAERDRWVRAAYLHDALRDEAIERLRELADRDFGVPALLHGPAAARRAADEGEGDTGVLDAVRYHSVGWAAWDDAGRMLYLADFLDPGKDFDPEGRADLAGRVPVEPAAILRDVTARRLTWAIGAGLGLPPESTAFWNAQVDAES